jgi:hypothetical protein
MADAVESGGVTLVGVADTVVGVTATMAFAAATVESVAATMVPATDFLTDLIRKIMKIKKL